MGGGRQTLARFGPHGGEDLAGNVLVARAESFSELPQHGESLCAAFPDGGEQLHVVAVGGVGQGGVEGIEVGGVEGRQVDSLVGQQRAELAEQFGGHSGTMNDPRRRHGGAELWVVEDVGHGLRLGRRRRSRETSPTARVTV